jgi:hypothetical protein
VPSSGLRGNIAGSNFAEKNLNFVNNFGIEKKIILTHMFWNGSSLFVSGQLTTQMSHSVEPFLKVNN